MIDELRRSHMAAITQNLKLLSYFELGKSLHSSTKLTDVFEDVLIQIRLITKTQKAYIVLHQANKEHEQLIFTINRENRIHEFKLPRAKAERFRELTAGHHPIIRSIENMKRIWYGEPAIMDSESRDKTLVLACPIIVRKKRLGDFVLVGNRFLEIFGQNDIYLFSGFAEQLGHAVLNSRYYQWSFKDSLTGLYVRRQLDEKFEQLVEEYQLKKRPFSIILIDFDFFKHINDEFGHNEGDRVLRDFSTFLVEQLRDKDIPIRYGGEEFAVLLPDATAELAEKVSHRISENLAEHVFSTGKSHTISQGVAEYAGELQLEDFISRADIALYAAKSGGRNRIVVAS
jgi:diguanylate cyclase (GGDEF)-like protein